MNHRTDPSSLSFGRRLSIAERDAAAARKEVDDLKKNLPAAKQMTEAAATLKAQRTSAKQMMARPDATVEQLQSIDATSLTPALREQLRHSLSDAAYRQMDFQSQPFAFNSSDAEIRFRSWQQSFANQEHVFEVFNSQPEPDKQYQRWLENQNSFEGRKLSDQQNREARERLMMQRRAEHNRNQKPDRSGGINLGGMRPLD